MKIRKPFLQLVICLAVVLLTNVAVFADTIKLRDGSVLKGKVVSYTQRKFTIVVYIGGTSSQHVIAVEEIESVEFDSSDVGTVSRADTAGPSVAAPSRAEPPRDNITASLPIETSAPRDEPRTAAEPETQPSEPNTGAVAAIAEKTVSVAGAADWTSTEIRVQRGQRIVISATGEVDLGDNQRAGPEGLSLSDNRKLIASRPTGALIAVVGDDNDDFVFVGKATEFAATHNGILFLSVNEGNLKDNAGAFVARVKVLSAR
ncbi:MAG TPA: hypothetical protein VJ810_04335 [Blastocatellia bacterium]|nr:hypothetical protein [Blastocatellia bacterium]